MPKIVTPATLKADSLSHADRAKAASTAAEAAIKSGDHEAAIAAAKTLEAAGCYIRRAVNRLNA